MKQFLGKSILVYTGETISGINEKLWLILFSRFLPFFFGLGAALEFSMINWTVGETNFYKTYKKRQAIDHIELKKQDMEH